MADATSRCAGPSVSSGRLLPGYLVTPCLLVGHLRSGDGSADGEAVAAVAASETWHEGGAQARELVPRHDARRVDKMARHYRGDGGMAPKA